MPCYVLGSRSAQRLARPRALSERCEPLARGTQSTSRTSSGAGAHSRRMSWPAGARGPIYFQGLLSCFCFQLVGARRIHSIYPRDLLGVYLTLFGACVVARGRAAHNLLLLHGYCCRHCFVFRMVFCVVGRTAHNLFLQMLFGQLPLIGACVAGRGRAAHSLLLLWFSGCRLAFGTCVILSCSNFGFVWRVPGPICFSRGGSDVLFFVVACLHRGWQPAPNLL